MAKAKCVWCDQAVQVCTPRGGDGSGYRFHRHYAPGMKGVMACEGSFADVDPSEVLAPKEESNGTV